MRETKKRAPVCRFLVSALFVLCAVTSPFTARAEKSGAAEVIRSFSAALLESMQRADELGYSGRYKLLEPVIKESFALSFMAGQSAGGYWKTLTKEQRDTFVKVYTDWTIASYAGRFDSYSGQHFELVSESDPDRGTVTVVSRLVRVDKEGVVFYYKLRKIEGKWLVVDIQISGVSQLALTRSQFVNVLKEKGFKGLISMLNDKIERFSQGTNQ
jgi:phospholipid transport system substrate-binding protein